MYPDCTVHPNIGEQWKRLQNIGGGTFGDVYLEELNQLLGENRELRAVKIVDKQRMKVHGIDYKKELVALATFSKKEVLYKKL